VKIAARIISLAILFLAITLPAEAGIAVQAWGGISGKGVDLYILTNARGMEARITNYGAVITAIRVPGRGGAAANVVQGFDRLADYTSPDYGGRYGAIIGRFANRIKDNTFRINGLNYHIARDAYVLTTSNNKPYDERVWSAETHDGDEPQLVLSLIDRAGTMGFPGTLRVSVTYTLTETIFCASHIAPSATRIPSSVSPTMPISTWPAICPAPCWTSC